MSAFLIENETISAIANKYCLSNYPESKEALAKELYDMNVKALNARYEDIEGMTIEFKYIQTASFDSLYQALKSLRCYLYQCSEGDIPEEELYKSLRSNESETMNEIIELSPEYNSADWK